MTCEICGIDTIRVRFGNQSLCIDCYNTVMAAELGIELPELSKTFVANDANGVKRIFEVERQITGTAILLTAGERWKHGYEFAVDVNYARHRYPLLSQPIYSSIPRSSSILSKQ